jgi:acetoin utilization deacetylase AcuC-like enzyme
MRKYSLLREQILDTRLLPPSDLLVPFPANDEQILRVHSQEYFQKLSAGTLSEKEIRKIGFPWSPQLIERSRHSVGGTISAAREALQSGLAVNLAGGTHHAFPDHGAGFCVLNDIAIAIRDIQADQLLQKVLIVDADVHQGDGSAAIFADDADVFTYSIHGEGNYPFRKERSDLDIGLKNGSGDREYLQKFEEGLSASHSAIDPELVLYLAGADPYKNDSFGKLSLSASGLADRDQMLFEFCSSRSLPLAVVMGGGYAPKVSEIAAIHFTTVKLAAGHAGRYADSFKGFD